MKIDREKADNGHYKGLTEWLYANVGLEWDDYRWLASHNYPDAELVEIFDPEKELLATLRWS